MAQGKGVLLPEGYLIYLGSGGSFSFVNLLGLGLQMIGIELSVFRRTTLIGRTI